MPVRGSTAACHPIHRRIDAASMLSDDILAAESEGSTSRPGGPGRRCVVCMNRACDELTNGCCAGGGRENAPGWWVGCPQAESHHCKTTKYSRLNKSRESPCHSPRKMYQSACSKVRSTRRWRNLADAHPSSHRPRPCPAPLFTVSAAPASPRDGSDQRPALPSPARTAPPPLLIPVVSCGGRRRVVVSPVLRCAEPTHFGTFSSFLLLPPFFFLTFDHHSPSPQHRHPHRASPPLPCTLPTRAHPPGD